MCAYTNWISYNVTVALLNDNLFVFLFNIMYHKKFFLTSLLVLLKYQIKLVFRANTYCTVDIILNYLKYNKMYYNHLLIYHVYQITCIKYIV